MSTFMIGDRVRLSEEYVEQVVVEKLKDPIFRKITKRDLLAGRGMVIGLHPATRLWGTLLIEAQVDVHWFTNKHNDSTGANLRHNASDLRKVRYKEGDDE